MKGKITKYAGFSLITFLLLVLVVSAVPVMAINVNVNQDTFVLSNEAPGYGISALVNAGYGDDNLYQALVDIAANTDPSVSGILTSDFLQTLKDAPVSSQIFSTKLKDVNFQDATIGINTDGTFLTNGVIVGLINFTTLTNGNIFGSNYQGKQGISSLDTVVSSAGNFRLVYNSSGPLTTWTINGPLAGMTTTYDVMGILYKPLSSSSPSPTSAATPTPSIPEFPSPVIIPVALALLLAAVILKQKKPQSNLKNNY